MPAEIKSRALNRAWVMRWKKASLGRFMARVATIKPSWLRVERAIIFLRSHSAMADMPAISIVEEAIKRRIGENILNSERVG